MNQDFALIYDEYYPRIYNYVYYRLLNRYDAEDVTAETFYSALDNFSQFERRNGASVSTWLFAIARNAVNYHFRKSQKAAAVPLEDAEPFMGTEDGLADWADRQHLRKLLLTLDDRSREALALRYWGGLSYAGVAEAMGITEKNASVLLTRAIAKLRKNFL